jgi:hypothetical protein
MSDNRGDIIASVYLKALTSSNERKQHYESKREEQVTPA